MSAPILAATLAAIQRRCAWRATWQGAALGLAVSGGVTVLLVDAGWSLAAIALITLLLTVSLVWWWRQRHRESTIAAAMRIEAADPAAQNVVRTAVELLDAPDRTSARIAAQVVAVAERHAQQVDVARVVPLQRAVGQAIVVAGLWSLTLVTSPSIAPAFAPLSRAASVPFSAVSLVITPPAYTGDRVRTERDPSRVTVRAGSQLVLTVRTGAARLAVARTARTDTLRPASDGTVSLRWRADMDDAVVLVALDSLGAVADQRVIGLSVTPDAAPRVRITTPGSDLLVPDGDRRVALTVRAEDDLAMASLRVRFTKVRGNGEQFAFDEGEVPLTITRRSPTDWEAAGELRLDTLKLEAGDVVVYRAVATDSRPGAAPTESDTWIIEVTAPGSVAAEGFAADEDQDRYALSQQMVIIKTERLLAQRGTLSPDAFAQQARTLAAEQRSVRAEFVFMMGGELGEEDNTGAGHLHVDESAEAEAEDDIYAGRLANQGRLELTRAVRAMSVAATRLTDNALTEALVEEKRALAFIERALARSRFILRALSQRERVDLSRRLTGTLSAVRPDVRAASEPTASPRVVRLRAAIAALAPLVSAPAFDPGARRTLQHTARELVQLAPADTVLQSVAVSLESAASRTLPADVRADRIVDVIQRLMLLARTELPRGAAPIPTLEERLLRGAVRDGAPR